MEVIHSLLCNFRLRYEIVEETLSEDPREFIEYLLAFYVGYQLLVSSFNAFHFAF